MPGRRRWLVVTMLATAMIAPVPVADAGGPWQGRVVDAETGELLEGVVVVLAFIKYIRTFGGPSPTLWAVDEVVTGPGGRFTARARRGFTLNPLAYFDSPDVTIFKSGYGQHRVRDVKPKWQRLSTGELLEKPDIVLELEPLKTRAERLKFYGRFRGPIAGASGPRYEEAVRAERAYLGLQP